MTSVSAHRRRSTYLGAGLAAGAGVLAAFAVLGSGASDPTVTDTEATVISAPITTQPDAGEPATGDDASTELAARPSPAPQSVDPLPVSPLAAELPARVSALPTYDDPVPPTRLTIADLALSVPVRGVGVEPDGQLEIPDETEVGWYRLGAAPGGPGATVLAGHVSWNDTSGPFARLGGLDVGAMVDVELSDGTMRRYEVTERAQYSKLGLPNDRIWTRTGDETLVLITCGGDFNREIRRYRDNIVVYARPVAASPALNRP